MWRGHFHNHWKSFWESGLVNMSATLSQWRIPVSMCSWKWWYTMLMCFVGSFSISKIPLLSLKAQQYNEEISTFGRRPWVFDSSAKYISRITLLNATGHIFGLCRPERNQSLHFRIPRTGQTTNKITQPLLDLVVQTLCSIMGGNNPLAKLASTETSKEKYSFGKRMRRPLLQVDRKYWEM